MTNCSPCTSRSKLLVSRPLTPKRLPHLQLCLHVGSALRGCVASGSLGGSSIARMIQTSLGAHQCLQSFLNGGKQVEPTAISLVARRQRVHGAAASSDALRDRASPCPEALSRVPPPPATLLAAGNLSPSRHRLSARLTANPRLVERNKGTKLAAVSHDGEMKCAGGDGQAEAAFSVMKQIELHSV